MRKQYMDFVPTKSANSVETLASGQTRRNVQASVVMPSGNRRGVRNAARSGVVEKNIHTNGIRVVRKSEKGTRVYADMPSASDRVSRVNTPRVATANVARGSGRSLRASAGAPVEIGRRTVAKISRGPLNGSNKHQTMAASGGTRKGVRGDAPMATSKLSISTTQKAPTLGVIEDTNSKFVRTDVPKRPLGDTSHFATKKTGLAAMKAKKVGIKGIAKGKIITAKGTGKQAVPVGAVGSVKSGATSGVRGTTPKVASGEREVAAKREKISRNAKNKGTYQMPKSPFINQNKIQKRPLSKNVYPKKIPVSKKEPSGPVTIISEAEKQPKVGLIVTIVLTIVLGAAAGTIAFLLLPK